MLLNLLGYPQVLYRNLVHLDFHIIDSAVLITLTKAVGFQIPSPGCNIFLISVVYSSLVGNILSYKLSLDCHAVALFLSDLKSIRNNLPSPIKES